MREIARRLVKRVPKQGTLREVVVVEAVEVVMDVDVEQAAEIPMDNVLLGVIDRKRPQLRCDEHQRYLEDALF